MFTWVSSRNSSNEIGNNFLRTCNYYKNIKKFCWVCVMSCAASWILAEICAKICPGWRGGEEKGGGEDACKMDCGRILAGWGASLQILHFFPLHVYHLLSSDQISPPPMFQNVLWTLKKHFLLCAELFVRSKQLWWRKNFCSTVTVHKFRALSLKFSFFWHKFSELSHWSVLVTVFFFIALLYVISTFITFMLLTVVAQ
jgi:hypothetical protein